MKKSELRERLEKSLVDVESCVEYLGSEEKVVEMVINGIVSKEREKLYGEKYRMNVKRRMELVKKYEEKYGVI